MGNLESLTGQFEIIGFLINVDYIPARKVEENADIKFRFLDRRL